MAQQIPVRKRKELSEFVTNCRKRLVPGDVGLPTTRRRRTPGLRREEVAALAGVGLTWYTWFEQGRDIQVSESFLLGVAKALKLDDDECHHLFLLAHQRPPPSEACQWQSVTPLIQQLLDDLTTRPAYVANLRWDVVAWNAAADALFGFSARTRPNRNVIRMVFADPDFRRRLSAWREEASKLVAQFRCDLATAPEDPAMLGLIDELKRVSPDFRRWFEQPGIETCGQGIGTVLTSNNTHLHFTHEILTVDTHRHLKMIVYFQH